jgi:hypothetical protein
MLHIPCPVCFSFSRTCGLIWVVFVLLSTLGL